MAVNAEQLPSGSWRCRVYDPVTKKYKSFTTKVKGKRGKQLIEAEANAWAASRKPKPIQEKPFGECIDDYIELKSNILSPTTLDKYRNIQHQDISREDAETPAGGRKTGRISCRSRREHDRRTIK